MTPDPDPTPRERAETFIETRAAHFGRGPLKLTAEAAKIARALAKKDPDAWNQFVDDVTVEVIVSRLRHYLASQRHAAVRDGRRSVFAGVIGAAETDEPPTSPFDAHFSLPGTNDWWRLGEMTRPDLLAVSHHRAKLSRTNAIEAIFLDALAQRLPDDTTTVEEALTPNDVITVHEKAETADLGSLPFPSDTDTGE